MIESSIFIDREDAINAEIEERDNYIKSILNNIGVPLEDVWPEIHLSVNQKIELRELLNKLQIEIVENDRNYKVYYQDDLLAEWFKPRFILRSDETAKSNKNKLYYEMIIKTNDVFEDENDQQKNKERNDYENRNRDSEYDEDE